MPFPQPIHASRQIETLLHLRNAATLVARECFLESAEHTDYVQIITRNDNWNEVFKPVFRRKEFVQESFQRLYPIRICTMHARIITQDDELYLYVEMKRLLNAIGIQE